MKSKTINCLLSKAELKKYKALLSKAEVMRDEADKVHTIEHYLPIIKERIISAARNGEYRCTIEIHESEDIIETLGYILLELNYAVAATPLSLIIKWDDKSIFNTISGIEEKKESIIERV